MTTPQKLRAPGDPGKKLQVAILGATGSIGQISIRHFARNPAYDLVGVYVTSDAKDGKDAGELASIDPIGVAATRNRGVAGICNATRNS